MMKNIIGKLITTLKYSKEETISIPNQKSRGLIREIAYYGCVMLCYVAAFAFKYKVSFSVIDVNELYYMFLDKGVINKNCEVKSAYGLYKILKCNVDVVKIYDKDSDVKGEYDSIEKMRIDGNEEIYHTSLYQNNKEVYQPWPGSRTSATGNFTQKRCITFLGRIA